MIRLRTELSYFTQLCQRLLLAMLLFSVCRAIFWAYNHVFFHEMSFWGIWEAFFYGIRFDVCAVMYANLLTVLLFLLPLPLRQRRSWQVAQGIAFTLPTTIAVLLELCDVAYFEHAGKRSTIADISLLANAIELLPKFLLEFWYLWVIGLSIPYFLYKIHFWLLRRQPKGKPTAWAQIAVFVVGLGLSVIGLRGGLQLRPLSPTAAAQFVEDVRLVPLASNSTLSYLFSLKQRRLEVPRYFPSTELDSRYSILIQPTPDTVRRMNVVIFALESFGKEYTGFFGKNKGYTPFLDSLLGESLYVENTYANGLRSTQGIVSMAAGIPSLMNEPLMFSAYQGNRFETIGGALRKKGYATAFFHGGNPGTMEFEKFVRLGGFAEYHDRRSYEAAHGSADYDGNWGIWDGKFLPFFVEKLNDYKPPFCAMLFTLSSHHPFVVPPDFAARYPSVDARHRTFLYADDALRQFFRAARQQAWYENTLFVFSADHTGTPDAPEYETRVGKYKIPICFYTPNGALRGKRSGVCQQTDIMPSVLDYLGYDQPFSAFGRSIFRPHATPNYAFQYIDGVYQLLGDRYALLFDGRKVTGLYDYQADIFCKNDLQNALPDTTAHMEAHLKAVIQRHHLAMTTNTLAP